MATYITSDARYRETPPTAPPAARAAAETACRRRARPLCGPRSSARCRQRCFACAGAARRLAARSAPSLASPARSRRPPPSSTRPRDRNRSTMASTPGASATARSPERRDQRVTLDYERAILEGRDHPGALARVQPIGRRHPVRPRPPTAGAQGAARRRPQRGAEARPTSFRAERADRVAPRATERRLPIPAPTGASTSAFGSPPPSGPPCHGAQIRGSGRSRSRAPLSAPRRPADQPRAARETTSSPGSIESRAATTPAGSRRR